MDTQAIVLAIEELSKKTAFDYVQWIAPLVLSVVAIGISIYTTRKQNQISLFKYRLDVLATLQLLFVFGESIEGANEGMGQLICNQFNSMFNTSIEVLDTRSMEKCLLKIKEMEKHFLMIGFLFKDDKGMENAAIKLVGSLQDLMINVINKKSYTHEAGLYCNQCREYDKEYYSLLERTTKIDL